MEKPNWKTKPTDRFILKWIKLNLSARITLRLVKWKWICPWHITLVSALLGCIAGLVFALGAGVLAAFIAAASQILDGVDGQLARITDRQTKGGGFWDSVLDRYADGAMMIGLTVYLFRLPFPIHQWILIILGALAIIGSNLVSYSWVCAGVLGIDLGKRTLASKGTRSSVMITCAFGSVFWTGLPIVALLYLALHTNLVIIRQLLRAFRYTEALP